MGKRRLCAGLMLGAAVGALITLLNDETRDYVKHSAGKVYDNANYYLNNPSVGVSKVKHSVVSLNEAISNNTDSAMNALNQIENSLNKFLK